MFKAVARASAEIHAATGDGLTNLQLITNVIEGFTAIDKVVFVRYDAEPENPIWGSFQKWVHLPGPYRSIETWVEVRYASHLDETWRRFVVCKELCHALEEDSGCHSVSSAGIDQLVSVFSLQSKKQPIASAPGPVSAEFLAEAAALELLCPMPIRRVVAALQLDDHEEVCAKYGIPYRYGWFAFGTQWIDAIEGFMK